MLVDSGFKFHRHVDFIVGRAGSMMNNLLRSTVCRSIGFMVTLWVTHIRPLIEPILKSFAQKSPPIVSNELQKHRDKKSIALFNVLLFRMSLKSIDIKISIAPSNVP